MITKEIIDLDEADKTVYEFRFSRPKTGRVQTFQGTNSAALSAWNILEFDGELWLLENKSDIQN